jgi:magnesium transporter
MGQRDGLSWFPLPRRGGATVQEPETKASNRICTPEEVSSAIVDCALYEGGVRRAGAIELKTALAEADRHPDGFVWIGLHDPSPQVVEKVAEHFGLHPLAVEDAVHAHQRPKLDVFGDALFLVLKTARYVDSDELVEIGEVMVFMGPKFVVTVRHGEGSPLHDVRLDLEAHPDLLGIGPSSVLYAVVDRIVDGYQDVIEGFAVDVEEIEAQVFSEDFHANPAQRIYKLKREVLEFKRAAAPLVTPVERLAGEGGGLPVDPRARDYFRDVHDHLVRDVERIQGFDELLTGVLQANFSQLTMRDNQDMRKISAWVAIAAVPTMIFGLYGMNFEHMPELKTEWGYPAVLVVTALICYAMYRRLKRAGWL